MHQVTVTSVPTQQPSPRRLAPRTLAISLAWEGFSQRNRRMPAGCRSVAGEGIACAGTKGVASFICMHIQLCGAGLFRASDRAVTSLSRGKPAPAGYDLLASSAWLRSAMMSSQCSIPIDKRTMSRGTPAFSSSSSLSWR
ncbi:hypothetical protein D3C80_1630500 [compost metagenome]